MRGTSRASLAGVRERFEPVLTAAGAQSSTLGAELFALVDALDASGSLRRVLADPSVEADAKAAVVAQVLAQADPRTVAVAQDLVRQRWSADADLGDAVETVGLDAVLAAAQQDGTLARVEDELFRLTRALVGLREVRRSLVDSTVPAQARAELVEAILAGRAAPATLQLARRAAAAPRGRRYVAALVRLSDLVAERRSRQVATVTSAQALSDTQRERLARILEQAYGSAIQVNVVVDPAVLGGLRVQVGAQVVDSTMLSRLADARRRLAS